MNNGIDKLAGGVGKVIDKVPSIYDDALKYPAQESGKFIGRIPRAINAAFAGIDKWILNKEYSVEETKRLLSEKLKHVTPSNIIEPEPYVAIPTIQALSYTINSGVLRDLFSNLLAKSMNSETKDNVHPAYIETIKQLSPDDASFFKYICELEYRPIVDVQVSSDPTNFWTIYSNSNLFSDGHVNNFSLTIDNLTRLGLIEIPSSVQYMDDAIYDDLIAKLQLEYNLESLKSYNVTYIRFNKKIINITPYGIAFYNTCSI